MVGLNVEIHVQSQRGKCQNNVWWEINSEFIIKTPERRQPKERNDSKYPEKLKRKKNRNNFCKQILWLQIFFKFHKINFGEFGE